MKKNHQTIFKILGKCSWGIWIQISGDFKKEVSKKNIIHLNLKDMNIRLSNSQIKYLKAGLKSVEPMISKKIDSDITINIEKIDLVLTDYQDEGLYYAIAQWAAELFDFEPPKFEFFYNKQKNKYEFPDLNL